MLSVVILILSLYFLWVNIFRSVVARTTRALIVGFLVWCDVWTLNIHLLSWTHAAPFTRNIKVHHPVNMSPQQSLLILITRRFPHWQARKLYELGQRRKSYASSWVDSVCRVCYQADRKHVKTAIEIIIQVSTNSFSTFHFPLLSAAKHGNSWKAAVRFIIGGLKINLLSPRPSARVLIPSPFSEGTKRDAMSILVDWLSRTNHHARAGYWEDNVA